MNKQLNLKKLYRRLFGQYGRQRWWPRTIPPRREARGKSVSVDPLFEVCVGAILTQNTAWRNVKKAIARMIEHKLMAPRAVVTCSTAKLQQCIRPAGYYKQKAKKLKIFARWLVKNYNGDFKKFCELRTDDCRLRLLALWGIGPETADSMLLYAGGKAIFVIDTYTKRLLGHCGITLKTYAEYQKFFMDRLPRQAKLYNEYHALIVAWGKENVKKAPRKRRLGAGRAQAG